MAKRQSNKSSAQPKRKAQRSTKIRKSSEEIRQTPTDENEINIQNLERDEVIEDLKDLSPSEATLMDFADFHFFESQSLFDELLA